MQQLRSDIRSALTGLKDQIIQVLRDEFQTPSGKMRDELVAAKTRIATLEAELQQSRQEIDALREARTRIRTLEKSLQAQQDLRAQDQHEPDVLETPSPPPPDPPRDRRREKRKRVVEYEDSANVPIPTPPSPSRKRPSLPPLPGKTHSPPPPPPTLPPPPSPNMSLQRLGEASVCHQLTPTPDSSPSTGRPFSADDLLQAKTLLRKPDDRPDVCRHTKSHNTEGDLAEVFSQAIDTRLMSIRKAAAPDSDDESDMEFEDIDEEWDD